MPAATGPGVSLTISTAGSQRGWLAKKPSATKAKTASGPPPYRRRDHRRGRRALAAWLAAPGSGPSGFALHFEPLLRVHLARAGTREDLLRALDDASALAAEIHRQGREVATEFLEGRHLLQDEAHIRALVFDFLWSLAGEIDRWATRTRAEVEGWTDLDPEGRTERGIELMRAASVRGRLLLPADPVLGPGPDPDHDAGPGDGGQEEGGRAPEVGGQGRGDEHGRQQDADHQGQVAGAAQGLAEQLGHGDRDGRRGVLLGGGDGFAALDQKLARRRTTAPLWPPRPIEFEMATSRRASRLFRGT